MGKLQGDPMPSTAFDIRKLYMFIIIRHKIQKSLFYFSDKVSHKSLHNIFKNSITPHILMHPSPGATFSLPDGLLLASAVRAIVVSQPQLVSR